MFPKKKKKAVIKTRKQQRLFGADLNRAKKGQQTITGMAKDDLQADLDKSAGKDLPYSK